MDKKRLKVLYKEIADLTRPKCDMCRAPNTCCSAEYCHLTMEIAEEDWGVKLERTGHPTLPLMGPKGCVAEPHLRPLCSVYVCEQHYMRDIAFSNEYFRLREEITEASEEMI